MVQSFNIAVKQIIEVMNPNGQKHFIESTIVIDFLMKMKNYERARKSVFFF